MGWCLVSSRPLGALNHFPFHSWLMGHTPTRGAAGPVLQSIRWHCPIVGSFSILQAWWGLVPSEKSHAQGVISDITKPLVGSRHPFSWPSYASTIKTFITECDICQWCKYECWQLARLLQPLPIPTMVWSDISMDFIEGLLLSYNKLVIICPLYSPRSPVLSSHDCTYLYRSRGETSWHSDIHCKRPR